MSLKKTQKVKRNLPAPFSLLNKVFTLSITLLALSLPSRLAQSVVPPTSSQQRLTTTKCKLYLPADQKFFNLGGLVDLTPHTLQLKLNRPEDVNHPNSTLVFNFCGALVSKPSKNCPDPDLWNMGYLYTDTKCFALTNINTTWNLDSYDYQGDSGLVVEASNAPKTQSLKIPKNDVFGEETENSIQKEGEEPDAASVGADSGLQLDLKFTMLCSRQYLGMLATSIVTQGPNGRTLIKVVMRDQTGCGSSLASLSFLITDYWAYFCPILMGLGGSMLFLGFYKPRYSLGVIGFVIGGTLTLTICLFFWNYKEADSAQFYFIAVFAGLVGGILSLFFYSNPRIGLIGAGTLLGLYLATTFVMIIEWATEAYPSDIEMYNAGFSFLSAVVFSLSGYFVKDYCLITSTTYIGGILMVRGFCLLFVGYLDITSLQRRLVNERVLTMPLMWWVNFSLVLFALVGGCFVQGHFYRKFHDEQMGKFEDYQKRVAYAEERLNQLRVAGDVSVPPSSFTFSIE